MGLFLLFGFRTPFFLVLIKRNLENWIFVSLFLLRLLSPRCTGLKISWNSAAEPLHPHGLNPHCRLSRIRSKAGITMDCAERTVRGSNPLPKCSRKYGEAPLSHQRFHAILRSTGKQALYNDYFSAVIPDINADNPATLTPNLGHDKKLLLSDKHFDSLSEK